MAYRFSLSLFGVCAFFSCAGMVYGVYDSSNRTLNAATAILYVATLVTACVAYYQKPDRH